MEKLKAQYPDSTVAGISPDLSDLRSVREAFRKATETYGCVDILVNNAGVSESTPFTEYTEEAFDKVMDLNVKGVFNATRAASECMVARGSGVILSTSSMVSIYGQPSGIAYPASKFAVNGLTVSLARELGPKGIRVNAVAPGIIETDMMKAVPKEVIEPMIAQIPLRRLGPARGHRQGVCVPGLGRCVVYHRRGAERGRHGAGMSRDIKNGKREGGDAFSFCMRGGTEGSGANSTAEGKRG